MSRFIQMKHKNDIEMYTSVPSLLAAPACLSRVQRIASAEQLVILFGISERMQELYMNLL